MKSMLQLSRLVFVVLSFAVLLLAGCGGGSDSTPTGTFTANQVSGKTFEYSSAGSTGTLVFNADSTWSTKIGSSTFSGTWSISDGKLVCVTTAGGNHTLTYTALVSDDTKAIHTSVVEVNPSDPANPATYTATLSALYTIAGKVSQSNVGWAGVTVALDGDRTLTATTDANGTYRFSVPAGEYRVTPSKGNTNFAPLDNSFAVSGADVGTVYFAVAPPKAGPSTNKWIQTGSLIYRRDKHTATLLQNGKVLVAGGRDSPSIASWSTRASAELYDPATGTWTQTGSLKYDRREHTATLLQNGRVLVTGGEDNVSTTTTAEIYDPATGRWTQTGSMAYDRYGHTATLLQDGRILVAGGRDQISTGDTAEIYDPATGKWTKTGSLNHKRFYHTATLLQNGKVLVAGGRPIIGSPLGNVEIYDPATGKWTDIGSLIYERYSHTATLLQNGRVLIAGGDTGAGGIRSVTIFTTSSAEIYDPATGKWTQTGSLADSRGEHMATLLQNGKVLIAGGFTDYYSGGAEIYDPATGKWTKTGSLNYNRTNHTATLLDSGLVLVAGGFNDLDCRASTELFFPGL